MTIYCHCKNAFRSWLGCRGPYRQAEYLALVISAKHARYERHNVSRAFHGK